VRSDGFGKEAARILWEVRSGEVAVSVSQTGMNHIHAVERWGRTIVR
jgi:hypothetical protein